MSDIATTIATVKVRTFGGETFTPEDAGNARRWYNRENDDAPIGKGRLANDVLFAWHSAGRPEVALPPQVSAYVTYRRIDSKGRMNGAPRVHVVLKSHMSGGRGRPTTASYLAASPMLTRENAIVTRIVTEQGAVHSVRVDDETGEYVFSWDSKSDSLEAVAASRGHYLAQTRA